MTEAAGARGEGPTGSGAAADPRRQLGLVSAAALVVASMVGTGVFTTSGFLLRDLGSRWLVLAAWAAGGVLALCGALCYGALARRMPESGGEYLFLSRALHPAAGCAAGWISLLVGFTAPLAMAAHAFGEYLQPFLGSWGAGWSGTEELLGTALIAAMTLVHATHVRRGALALNLGVALNLALIGAFLVLAALGSGASPPPAPAEPAARQPAGSGPGLAALGVGLIQVSFAYSGWNTAVYIGGEVRSPRRNLPWSLALGAAAVTGLYLALNAAFLRAAEPQRLSGQLAVGRIAAEALGGAELGRAMSLLIAMVLMACASAMVMVGPRVLAKMAEDGFLPRFLQAPQATATAAPPPRAAIILLSALALAMLWLAAFETLLTYVGFTLGLSAAATVLALVLLRRREGPARVPVPGWPVAPVLFLLATLGASASAISEHSWESLWGLGTIAAGLVFWLLTRPAS